MYHGLFQQSHVAFLDPEDTSKGGFAVSLNEDGVDYSDIMNSKCERKEFVVLTDPRDNLVCGVDRAGAFGFPIPYHVYTLDEVPEEVQKDMVHFTYTEEEGFQPFFDIRAWRYNCRLSIQAMKMELFMGTTDIDKQALIDFEQAVESYQGEGPVPVFLN